MKTTSKPRQSTGEASAAKATLKKTTADTTMDLAGSKLRRSLSKVQSSSALIHAERMSAPVSEFAQRQLEKMGWQSGTGLGKHRNGMESHIRVHRREDQQGLGQVAQASVQLDLQNEWWKQSMHSTLSQLKPSSPSEVDKKKKKKKQKKDRTSKNKSPSRATTPPSQLPLAASSVVFPTDDELFQATGGIMFGTKGGSSRKLSRLGSGHLSASSIGSVKKDTDETAKKQERRRKRNSSDDDAQDSQKVKKR
jgi:G-patch domain